MRLSFLVLPMLVGAAVAQHAPATEHRRHHAKLAVRADTNGTDSAATDDGGGGDTAVTSSPQAQVVSTAKDAGVTTSPDAGAKTTADNNAVTTAKTTPAQNVETDTEAAVAVTSDKVISSVVASTTAPSSVVTAAVTSASAVVATSATPVASVVADVTTSRSFADTTAPHTSSKLTLVVTTGTSTATASAAAASSSSSSGGLAKGALIAIIIVASVIGVAAVGWTLFRKWKLRPSNRFDSRMQPIDFSPGGDMHDDFIEKTLQRSTSVTSADRQRQEFANDLDNGHSLTHGIPEHDFTAGAAGAGLAYGHYDPDPYEHGSYRNDAPYDFSSPSHAHGGGDGGGNEGAYGYPAAPQQAATGYPPQHQYYNEYPTQDHSLSTDGHSSGDGYANVQRGPSGSSPPSLMPMRAQAPFDPLAGADFSVDGRPTGGTLGEQGPYAQAATYRY